MMPNLIRRWHALQDRYLIDREPVGQAVAGCSRLLPKWFA